MWNDNRKHKGGLCSTKINSKVGPVIVELYLHAACLMHLKTPVARTVIQYLKTVVSTQTQWSRRIVSCHCVDMPLLGVLQVDAILQAKQSDCDHSAGQDYCVADCEHSFCQTLMLLSLTMTDSVKKAELQSINH